MPGVSLRCIIDEKNEADQNYRNQQFLDASKSIIRDNYYREVLVREHPHFVIYTKYPEYPVKILESSVFWICIEGKIYNKTTSTLQNELYDLTRHIFNSEGMYDREREILADWLSDADGDFVIYGMDKNTKDFFVLNDFLGRLPFYYFKNDAEIIASREIQLMSDILDNTNRKNKFDMMGVAQFLLFSHTLGKRTLLSNVSKLEPATLLKIHVKNSKIETHNLYVFNFEEKKHANEGKKKNVHELVPLFLDACKNRVDHNAKNIISLSGGLDSRAVAASLRKNKITCYAVTSPEPVWRPVVGNLSETEIAQKLATELKIECENYDMMIPKAIDLVKLLRIKNGLIYLAHSFLPSFLQKVKDKNELTTINFFTGHGGDISFTNLSFNVRDVDSWARSILRAKGRLPLAIVAALTRINEDKIMEELKDILTTYPEKDLSLKNAHFLFFENNVKFSFEIEDVNRFYFWTVAPFYSVPFFKYIFNCSDKDKEKLALYKEFMLALSPVAASINISNWSCSIMSMKFKILQTTLYLLFEHRKLRNFIKKIYDKRAYSYKNDSKIIECIREQVKDCSTISDLLTYDIIEKILNNCSHYDHEGIDNLFTIISVLEHNLCDKSTINKYY